MCESIIQSSSSSGVELMLVTVPTDKSKYHLLYLSIYPALHQTKFENATSNFDEWACYLLFMLSVGMLSHMLHTLFKSALWIKFCNFWNIILSYHC